MKRNLFFILSLFLFCCMFLLIPSTTQISMRLRDNFSQSSHQMKLPQIGSQKSEYDMIYGMKMTTGFECGVPPLPNSSVYLEAQQLK